MASDRERPYVRGVQVSALLNRGSVDARLELVKVANEMRKNGEPIDGRLLRELRGIYQAALHDKPSSDRLIVAVNDDDSVRTITARALERAGAPVVL